MRNVPGCEPGLRRISDSESHIQTSIVVSGPVGRSQLARDQTATLKSAGRSLMPDGLLAGRSDADLRDLFAYLRINQPLVLRKN